MSLRLMKKEFKVQGVVFGITCYEKTNRKKVEERSDILKND